MFAAQVRHGLMHRRIAPAEVGLYLGREVPSEAPLWVDRGLTQPGPEAVSHRGSFRRSPFQSRVSRSRTWRGR